MCGVSPLQRLTPAELASQANSDDEGYDFEAFVKDDRNEIDDFVDVAVEEKEFMHLWNVFVHRHPIYCDTYTGLAAEAFTRQVHPSPVGAYHCSSSA